LSQARDTGATATARESAVTTRDTAKAVAAKPPRRRPAQRPAAPAQPRRVDTAAPAVPSPPAAADTASSRGTADTATTDTATASTQTANTAPAAAPTTQANAPLRDQYHPAPLDTVPQQVYDGWKQYNLNCARCHGEDVLGTTIAPHLLVSLKPGGPINTKESFIQTVCAGRPAKGMPAWCPLGMEMSTIEEIYAYVKGRSDGKLRPGRPALREGG
ncbi:MAG TPA: cytochrome c, partial [Gemmatimonadales bacterium]|nr:cytochrome c [Gemmatimonadales bacterium]